MLVFLDRCSPGFDHSSGLAYAAYHLVNPYFSLIEFATNSASNTKASIVGYYFDSYLTIQPEGTSEQVLAGGTTEGAKTLETIDRSGEEGLVPKAGFEPAHPCGR